jgi:paraquat-inducible protein B
MNENATPDDALSLLQSFAQQGLRARLTTGNILSGALVVELVDVPNAAPAELDATAQPYALFPTTDNAITDVANRAEDVLTRINDLPIEELMQGAIDLMESVERLTNDESLRQVPVELTGLLADTRALVGSEDVQGVPADVRGAIADVNAQVATLIGDIQGLVGSDDVKAVPIEINALIGEMNAIVDEITQAQLADKLVATLDNANGLVANLDTATQGLPAITEELAALTSKANALELEALVAEATATLDSINALVGSESTQDIPASLSNALDEMALFLTEVREGGAINNVNAALASASQAAQAIETSVAGLPALSNRANALVAQTEAVIAGYGERSRFSAETLATLREVQAAADSISALARAIQRNPNSLLTGR